VDEILVIFDLDETLIHSTSRKPLIHVPDFIVGNYYTFKRPGLDDFLKTVCESFRTAVWSAGSPDYVDEIVKNIFPGGKESLEFVWAFDRCVRVFDPETMDPDFIKPLNKVKKKGYDIEKMLIVEDKISNCRRNYGNAIFVPRFEGQQNDKCLKHLVRYLMEFRGVESVRHIDKKGWLRRYE